MAIARLLPVILLVLAVICTGMECLAEEVTLEIFSECYLIGDTVYFAITNGLSSTVAFYQQPIYEIRDSSGTEIYPVVHIPWIIHFEPAHSDTFFWTQQYSEGGQVPEGMYYITASWYVQSGPPDPGGTAADTLWIAETSGVEPPFFFSWGRVKALFK